MLMALAWSRQVTARIRGWWLNVTVTLRRIHAACSEVWLLGCNHKSNSTGSKDEQKQKDGEFWPKKEGFLEDTHLFFISSCRKDVNEPRAGFLLYKLVSHDEWQRIWRCINSFTFWHAKDQGLLKEFISTCYVIQPPILILF